MRGDPAGARLIGGHRQRGHFWLFSEGFSHWLGALKTAFELPLKVPRNALLTQGFKPLRRPAGGVAQGVFAPLAAARSGKGLDRSPRPLYILRATMICRRPASVAGRFFQRDMPGKEFGDHWGIV